MISTERGLSTNMPHLHSCVLASDWIVKVKSTSICHLNIINTMCYQSREWRAGYKSPRLKLHSLLSNTAQQHLMLHQVELGCLCKPILPFFLHILTVL